MNIEVNSVEETVAVSANFAKRLKQGDIIALHGDIGVGKTVFVRGIVSYFGDETDVTSPTFSIMNIYNGKINVYHFDLYRLEDEEEIYESGLDEYIFGNGISLVEWPDIIGTHKNYDVTIEKNLDKGENYRKITIIGDDL